jgi:hypothetical protein
MEMISDSLSMSRFAVRPQVRRLASRRLSRVAFLLVMTLAGSLTPTVPTNARSDRAAPSGKPPLTSQEFVRHYVSIALIRYTFEDDPAGYSQAMRSYLEKNGVTIDQMKAFARLHRGDVAFWKTTWEQIEVELRKNITSPHNGD